MNCGMVLVDSLIRWSQLAHSHKVVTSHRIWVHWSQKRRVKKTEVGVLPVLKLSNYVGCSVSGGIAEAASWLGAHPNP